ncbi:SpoIIE family protein phosphatase [Litoribacter ruber]|uniref:SpoIIE family protein phosphatase n=1 Tax=Litoribacter ruber TaxID=702568 RepID=A0AAP2CI39_9BACT|nr:MULTISPECIES: SpoIIE family protein phosphatase [Litoribacter]MBS9524230.1 SpoIIE family protein phosphatase [Litoribacter alkaliphilus]MBT0809972.1 SpoIIE family protein phosphatase [Litoribacter ruber]
MLKIFNLNIGRIALLLAIITWLALLFVDLVRLFGAINRMDTGFSPEITWILQTLFFIMVFLFFHNDIKKNEGISFLDLIWKGVSTGLFAAGITLLIRFFYFLLGNSRLSTDPLLKNFFYHVNFGLSTIFLISVALIWRQLILYQKDKNVVQQWQAFEIILLVSMFFVFFNQTTFNYSFIFGLFFIYIFGIILSVNLKWIPYLTFKEKWKSILFLVIILLSTGFLFFHTVTQTEEATVVVSLTENLFLLGLFGFVFIYALFSFLVTLFNLPTSSVFEQKLTEAINFQKLSQSIQPGQSENEVMDILMDSCMSAAYVDAAWLELSPLGENPTVIHQRFISEEDRVEVEEQLKSAKPFKDFLSKEEPKSFEYLTGKIKHPFYKSALIIPLRVNKEVLGHIYLLKEVKDGFNKEMINIISTFVGQASISVENHRLLSEAIRNERYKEELEIAQRVQRSLLPSVLHKNECFDIAGLSEAADEVGGDYYETFQFTPDRFAIIIGDVSGKGTSAAFNMSQMKGVFHTLVQQDLPPSTFLSQANGALGRCLEKNHFITTTYYVIDTATKSINYSRAGHCPTLYYSARKNTCAYLEVDGLGLGILRNSQYSKFIKEKTLQYQPGDIMLMYTDGIIEAKNGQGEEFGFENLQEVLEQNYRLSPEDLVKKIMEKVYEFIGTDTLPDDDYSLLIVKFLK